MIFLSKDAEDSLDKLLYYPYTIGRHLSRAINDVNNIMNVLNTLPTAALGVIMRRTIPNVGTITYLTTHTSLFIQYISWSTVLTRFYYVKSNFIVFNTQGNIPSVHPALYLDRTETYFKCDNGFKVVSRKYRGKDVFNFKNLNGNIICDIDFIQVKPFDEYKDMTARGYTPDRRCFMIFEDGYKEEINENRQKDFGSIIIESSTPKNTNNEIIYTTQFKGRFVDSELEKPDIYKENKRHNTMDNTKKRIRLTESQLHNIIKMCIKESFNEMSLHHKTEKGVKHVGPNNGWAPRDLENWKWKYDKDTIDRYTWRVKKTAEKEGACGPKGWPIAGWFGKNFDRFFSYLEEYGGDLDEVPEVDDTHEMSPEELYAALDGLFYKNGIGYENYRTFNRSTYY